jgi:formimidoylglutamate deiminase
MAGAAADTALDRLLFAGADRAIRDVMVGGKWVVKAGRHGADEQLRADFGRTMNKLRTT